MSELMKYVRKSTCVDAIQWDETIATLKMLQNVGLIIAHYKGHVGRPNECTGLGVFTPEGAVDASKGDWIIKYANGDFRVCTPWMFSDCYEGYKDVEAIERDRDLLRRQVEVLVNGWSKTAECWKCKRLRSISGLCPIKRDPVDACKREIVEWSLEQAKKGGGGE